MGGDLSPKRVDSGEDLKIQDGGFDLGDIGGDLKSDLNRFNSPDHDEPSMVKLNMTSRTKVLAGDATGTGAKEANPGEMSPIRNEGTRVSIAQKLSSVQFDPKDFANTEQSFQIKTPKNNKIMPAPLATIDSNQETNPRSKFDMQK
jgi:hypothetical protein